jgi:Zn-dependent protease
VSEAFLCPHCRAISSADDLLCRSCGRLLHQKTVEKLTSDARMAEQVGALQHAWELNVQALALLPPGLPQARTIAARMEALRAKAAPPRVEQEPQQEGRWAKWLGSLGPIGLLLAGMGKLKTIFSALAFLGVYWAAYGWKFALGIVVSIYIHEMGHVAAFRRNGIAVSAPMFIPGLGAFVRGARRADTPGQDARISLAGPLWGLGAAFAALVLGSYYHSPVLMAIASTGAWINILNLIPVAIFDGAGAFRALARGQRGTVAAAAAVLFWMTGDILLMIVAGTSIFRVFTRDAPAEPDSGVLFQFLAVMAALSLVVFTLRG